MSVKSESYKKTFLIIFLSIIAVGMLGIGNVFRSPAQNPSASPEPTPRSAAPSVPCIQSGVPIDERIHIHPHVKIIINGKEVKIPKDVGEEFNCERIIHTHDNSGTIHIEPNMPQSFTLGDFFNTWGLPFSKYRISELQVDENHQLTMTVNGAPNEEFEKLVLKDKQEILIEYK